MGCLNSAVTPMKEDDLDVVTLGRQEHLLVHRAAREDTIKGACRCDSGVRRQWLSEQQCDEASCSGHGDLGGRLQSQQGSRVSNDETILACIYVSKPSERVHDRTLTSGLPSQETMLTCRSKSVSLGSFRGSIRRAPGRVWRPHSQQTLTLSTP